MFLNYLSKTVPWAYVDNIRKQLGKNIIFFLKICLFAYFEAESLFVALVVLEFAM